MRKPGHREGVRRYQRYDQTALGVVGTLAYDIPIEEPPTPEQSGLEHDIGTCQNCGAYWFLTGPDARLRCPLDGGYVG